jgi:hypothetical protein
MVPIAEVILYKEKLSQANREKIESYLAIKYGITLSQKTANIASNYNDSTTATVTNVSSLGQTFTANATANVNAISFVANTTNTATAANVYICSGVVNASTCIATPGATASLTLPASPSELTTVTAFIPAGFAVTSGSTYTIHVRPASGNLILSIDNANTHYMLGSMYTADTNNTTQDLNFSVDAFATTGRDYVASNGSVVFDASEGIDTGTDNSGLINPIVVTSSNDDYVYNVSAIAKDNSQLLVNTKSRSESEAIPFLTTEIENSALLDDKEFMFVGSNNAPTGSSSINSTEMPVVGLPTATNSRLAREWRVQKNAVVSGSVVTDPAMGTFKLSFDLDALGISPTNVSGYRLVVDDNGVFSAGSQTIYPASGEPLYDSATNSVYFTGVSLVDGQYFTLALPRVLPGGVGTSILSWYRADSGTTTTVDGTNMTGVNAVWKDQSGNNNHVNGVNQDPQYFSSTNTLAINYNPTIDFDGTDDYFNIPATAYATGNTPYTIRAISNLDVSSAVLFAGGNTAATNNGLALSVNTNRVNDAWWGNNLTGNTTFSTNSTNLLGSRYNPGTGIDRFVYLNGRTDAQLAESAARNTISTNGLIGTYVDGSGDVDGRLSELLIFNASLSDVELQKVDSYLAAKYGITLSGGETQFVESANATVGLSVGQTFTASSSGELVNLTLKTGATTPNNGTATLRICNGVVSAATCIATPNYSQVISVPTALSTVFTTSLTSSFSVIAGSQYTFVITATANTILRANATDAYIGGNAINTAGTLAPADLYFSYLVSTPDYIASNGTTEMWNKDRTGASTHNLGIAVVGRDDVSGLLQYKSKSQTVTGSPIIEIVNQNATTVADMEFLAVGGDNTAVGVQTNEMPAGLPAETNNRLMREWQIQKVGDVGTVNVSWNMAEHNVGPLNMSQVKLLIKNADDNFSSGVTISPITPTLSGTTITFSGITFNDGDYFTVALPVLATAPGGVTAGMKLWLRADKQTFTDTAGATLATAGSDVALIKDFSGNGNNFSQSTALKQPKLVVDTNANYQNTLQFCQAVNANAVFGSVTCTADLDTLTDADGILGTNTYSNASRYIFSMVDNIGSDYIYSEATAAATNGFDLIVDGTNYISDMGDQTTNEKNAAHTSLNTSDHTYYMISEIGSTTDDGDGSIGQRVKKDGRVFTNTTDATYQTFTGINGLARLSGSQAGGSDTNNINGRIGEVIVYAQNCTQTIAETQRIETYMALKYGKTLSNVDTLAGINEGDYVLSDGTTVVWAGNISGGVAGADAALALQRSGYGRDDLLSSISVRSKSINNDEIMTLLLTNDFTAANSDHHVYGTVSLLTKTAIMWGHNGGSQYFDTAVSTTNTNTRMGRVLEDEIHRCRIYNTISQYQFSNPNVLRLKNGQNYVLLESAAADMSPTELAPVRCCSGTNSSVTFAMLLLLTVCTTLSRPR